MNPAYVRPRFVVLFVNEFTLGFVKDANKRTLLTGKWRWDFSLTESLIEDKSTIREGNDNLYFDSGKPRSYRSLGHRSSRALTVIYNKMP
jgi:hypothetical protein